MSAGKIVLIVVGVILALILITGGCVLSGYNQAKALDEGVNNKWAQVENQLQRRFDLVPNLVQTVKGVAKQEEKIYLGVAEARKAYFRAGSVNEKARAAGDFERALSRLLVLREAYPELKSNVSFLKLQDQLEGTENRLAVERKRYNDAVTQLNTFVRQLPGQFYASLAGVQQAEYFRVEEAAKETPKVAF